jgi:hypothetical protein
MCRALCTMCDDMQCVEANSAVSAAEHARLAHSACSSVTQVAVLLAWLLLLLPPLLLICCRVAAPNTAQMLLALLVAYHMNTVPAWSYLPKLTTMPAAVITEAKNMTPCSITFLVCRQDSNCSAESLARQIRS